MLLSSQSASTHMHIFLDESGSFAASQQPGSFSLVCGFVVVEAHLKRCVEVLRRFKVANGFTHDQEIKRRDVCEQRGKRPSIRIACIDADFGSTHTPCRLRT